MIGKVKIELVLAEDGTGFVNFWDIYGNDVVAELDNKGQLIQKGEVIPFGSFIEQVIESVKKQP